MPLPQVPPGGGGRPARTHWSYVSTQGGAKPWLAWIAGPCHWFMCHPKGKTKPCLHEMTAGELGCPRCEAGQLCELTGYQPLYRNVDAKPVCVIVHEYSRETVDRLKLHDEVFVGRGAEKSDGVYLTPTLSRNRYTSTLPERLRPADMTESLLRMWKIPELEEWYRQTHKEEPAPAQPARPEPKQSNGQPFSPMHRAAARRYTAPTEKEPAELDAVMGSIEEKFRLPSRNGKAPPKG